MKETTLKDKIIDFLFTPYYKVRYFFAKQWLDSNFGESEYWGDEILELLSYKKHHTCIAKEKE